MDVISIVMWWIGLVISWIVVVYITALFAGLGASIGWHRGKD